jgi:hypothetical protein
MAQEAMAEAIQRIKSFKALARFVKYQTDPVGFCREVLSVEPTEDCQKIMYSVRDNPVTVVKSSNAVGKTHTGACVSLWWLNAFPFSKTYLAAAPPIENLDQLLLGEIHNFVGKKKNLFSNWTVKRRFIGQKEKKWWIWGLAIPTQGTLEQREAKFSGKHAPHLLFIFDEGDAIPDEVYTGADSCMSSDHARMLIMFNPRAQVGSVYRKIRDHQARVITLSALSHPNVVTGENRIPGAVSREITVQRINTWTRPLMEGEAYHENDTFDVPNFLIGALAHAPDGTPYSPLPAGKRKIIDPAFCYKVMGEYPYEGETQLIQETWISAARARWDLYVAKYGEVPPSGVRPRMGQDIAEFGTDANVCCLRYGGWVAPFKYWTGVDVDVTSSRAVEIYQQYGPELAIIDATAIGASVAPSMVRKGRALQLSIRAVGVKASESPTPGTKTEYGDFQYVRDQLWWAVREWLKNDPGAMLPPDNLLVEELKAPTYHIKPTNSKLIVTDKDTLRKRLLRSPDRADALCLTFMPVARVKVVRAVD